MQPPASNLPASNLQVTSMEMLNIFICDKMTNWCFELGIGVFKSPIPNHKTPILNSKSPIGIYITNW